MLTVCDRCSIDMTGEVTAKKVTHTEHGEQDGSGRVGWVADNVHQLTPADTSATRQIATCLKRT